MNKIGILLIFAFSSLMLAGCITMSSPALTTGKADSYMQHEQTNGVIVAIHPLTNKTEIENMFEVNLLKKGLLPILVVAENQSTADSFIIAKEKISVLCEATGVGSTSQQKVVTSDTAGTAVGATGAVLLGAGSLAAAPILFAGLKMASNATVIQHNLADKEFYSRTLGPGEKAQGFVYFQFQKDSLPSGNYHIVAEIKNSATGEKTLFDFAVNLTLPQ